MPVNKITADQFVDRLDEGILSRNDAHDVELGPIPNIITFDFFSFDCSQSGISDCL